LDEFKKAAILGSLEGKSVKECKEVLKDIKPSKEMSDVLITYLPEDTSDALHGFIYLGLLNG
jgi:hypothetical protein